MSVTITYFTLSMFLLKKKFFQLQEKNWKIFKIKIKIIIIIISLSLSSPYHGPIDDMQIVRDWFIGPRDVTFQRGELDHSHHSTNI